MNQHGSCTGTDCILCTNARFLNAGANMYSCINDALNYYKLTTFQSSLYWSGLTGEIAMGQPPGISVFVPTNAAFSAWLIQKNWTMQQLNNDRQLLERLMAAHIVPSKAYLCPTLPLETPLQTRLESQTITPILLPG